MAEVNTRGFSIADTRSLGSSRCTLSRCTQTWRARAHTLSPARSGTRARHKHTRNHTHTNIPSRACTLRPRPHHLV